jgi:hypothetical protein
MLQQVVDVSPSFIADTRRYICLDAIVPYTTKWSVFRKRRNKGR